MPSCFALPDIQPLHGVVTMLTQEHLESHALSLGQQRFTRRVEDATKKGEAASVGAGLSLVRLAMQPLAAAVEQMLIDADGKRGVKHIAVKIVAKLGPSEDDARKAEEAGKPVASRSDVAAYMTVRTVLSAAIKRVALPIAALDLADLIVDELRYRRFQEEAPELYAYKAASFDTSNIAHRRRSLDASMRFAKIDTADVELLPEQREALGIKLIDLLVTHTDLVVVEDISLPSRGKRSAPKSTKILQLTPDAEEWLDERNVALEMLLPVALPMVETPLPWGPNQRGGYRYGLRGKQPFVRSVSKEHAKTLAGADMAMVYDAVNAIQSTAWKINPDVLELMRDIKVRGGGLGGIPELQPLVIPQEIPRVREFDRILKHRRGKQDLEPLTGELAEYSQAIRVRRKKVAPMHAANHQRRAARRELDRLLYVADMFSDAPAMYFVHNVDFRGRVYPVANYLTPQGDDRSKALLTFTQGRPLGRDGARFLAQHGMNCLGETPDGQKVSKLTIEERVEWVETHDELLLGVALDPFTNTWWSQADDPFQFYAFCCEWSALLEWRAAACMDENFISALPCSVDGTCNGLQHWGAMFRCERTGASVNLLPNARPSDIYTDVQGQVVARLEKDAAGDDATAQLWLRSGLISRKLCKRPVMTMPYGSKVFGFRSQIMEYLEHRGSSAPESKKLWEETKTLFTSDEARAKEKSGDLLKGAVGYLASVIAAAIRGTVVKAAEGMEWMQQGARKVAGQGKCVTWTVPATGFVVKQEYMVQRVRQVKTVLCGSVYRPRLYENTDKPAAFRQANAIAPNFVHSLDAAALMLTVQAARIDGVESFAMVHDSYGAPAGCCSVLARATRQAFVGLYTEHDVVGGLHATMLDLLGDEASKLPVPPAMGGLDLSGVLVSDFFFA